MQTLALVFAYLRHNWQRTFFNVLLFALGTALIALVLNVSQQMERNFTRNLAGIDLVVGAKGSPLQLVLSAVLHADVPTGNIALKDAQELEKNPMIKTAIPVALGDNIQGYRIVGTTPAYAAHYNATLAEGRMFQNTMEAVLGADVAKRLPFKVGQKFAGSHGLTPGGEVHDFAPYTVTGILKPTGTVLDRLVLTPVDSVWYVHENDDDEPVAIRPTAANREVTALLISYTTPLAVASLPRLINKQTNMQAASPAMEATRLRQIMGVGSDALKAVGAALTIIAGLGLLIAMAEAMRQRLYDLALMRCFGASPRKVIKLLVTEAVIISLLGGLIGLAASWLGAAWVSGNLLAGQLSTGSSLSWQEAGMLLAGVLGLGIISALLPAVRVYRLPLAHILASQ